MDAAGGTRPRTPVRRWVRKAGHAAVAAGIAGIVGFVFLFAQSVAAGPPISFGAGARLFLAVMPAALFAPVVGTLPVLALGLITQKSWRGPPPLAIWALAGGAAGLAASLILARTATTHLGAAALGALALCIFGYFERAEALRNG